MMNVIKYLIPPNRNTTHSCRVHIRPYASTALITAYFLFQMIFLIWTSVLIAVIVLYFNKVYSRFSDCGVKHFRAVPFVGNMAGILLRQRHFYVHLDRLYYTFKNERLVLSYVSKFSLRFYSLSAEWLYLINIINILVYIFRLWKMKRGIEVRRSYAMSGKIC